MLFWFRLHKTAESLKLAIHQGRRLLRGARADLHGPCDHGDSAVARAQGDRCHCFTGRAGRRLPFVLQRQIPMVLPVRKTTEIPHLLFFFGGRCPCCCRSCLPCSLLSTTGAHGSDSAEMRGGAAGAASFVVVDVAEIIQRRAVSRTVKVPQTQFIAGVCGHSPSQQKRVSSAGYGGDEGFLSFFKPFFALRPSGR